MLCRIRSARVAAIDCREAASVRTRNELGQTITLCFNKR